MNSLKLYMMNFDFAIWYKQGSKMRAAVLSRSFLEITAISARDMNWVHKQEKGNLSNMIKERPNKKCICKFSMPDWYKMAEYQATMVVF
jgi:hypothetical protein